MKSPSSAEPSPPAMERAGGAEGYGSSASRMGFLEGVKIVGLCILAAVGYGVAHDLVTAHLSFE